MTIWSRTERIFAKGDMHPDSDQWQRSEDSLVEATGACYDRQWPDRDDRPSEGVEASISDSLFCHAKSCTLLWAKAFPLGSGSIDSLAKFSALNEVSTTAGFITDVTHFVGSLPLSVTNLTVLGVGVVCNALKIVVSRGSIAVQHIGCRPDCLPDVGPSL
ncbi:hypothetical protein CSUB01_03182 [Colletotrichum sublineola]|uniref:Uncharacterized protein n=1 Tax=Colletotrichum sublineola TaxID=1173701 RepID=A0A066X2H2_COLSU|nr:hypothetical protein CSUB01_03182 [Colletotrichum sublineola]